MPTIIDDASSGIFTQQIADGGANVKTRDQNKDGVVDAVRFEGAVPTGLQADSDGWVSVATEEAFQAVDQALRDMGLGIVGGTQIGEVLRKLDEPLQLQFGEIAKSVASGLVLQSGSANNYADVQGQWADFISNTGINGELDVNALVQQVLREAYMENTEDLRFYAQKVKYFNELKDQVRSQLTEARKLMSLQAGKEDTAAVTLTSKDGTSGWSDVAGANAPVPQKVEFDSTPEWNPEEGRYTPDAGDIVGDGSFANKADLEQYISSTEEFLNSVGDDAQLANVDLQNMLQKQQQTLQMMSNISKMLHDTAMAIIRKMG